MQRILRLIMPFVAAGLSVWAAYDLVIAVQDGRMGRAAFKVVGVLVWLFAAYLMYDTGKRIKPDGK
jgi:hypothetical protein